jgi:RimJ/RimL family protein N-acetyltransferase
MTLPIRTERLLLRRYTYDDVADILSWATHPSVAGEAKEVGSTEESVRSYIDVQNGLETFEEGKCFDLAIERLEDGKVIGMVSLVRREPRQGMIGWALGVDYRGQGYATEAARGLIGYGFSTLGLHRIQADTNSANTRSWRLMERLGMRPEGRLQEASFFEGSWVDRLIYGLLSAEWESPSG